VRLPRQEPGASHPTSLMACALRVAASIPRPESTDLQRQINIIRKTVKVLGPPVLKPANLISDNGLYRAFFWEVPVELYAEHTLVYYRQDRASLNDWVPYGKVVKGKLVVGGFKPSPPPVYKYVAASIKYFFQREIIAAADRRTAEDSVLLIFKLCSYTKLPVAAQVCSIAGKAGDIAFDIAETGGVRDKTLASLAMGVVIDSVIPSSPLLKIPVGAVGDAALSPKVSG